MLCKASLILLFLASVAYPQLNAQRAKYTTIPASYDVKIPERNGVLVHVWGASAKQTYTQSQSITLTLYIFTPDMRLLAHRNVRLGKLNSWNMDFQYSDTCYYVNIYYRSDSLYHALVRVSNEGVVTDMGNRPEVWNKSEPFRRLNKIYALERCNNNLYSIKIENADTSVNVQESNFIPLEKTPATPNGYFQKIIIKKVNLTTKEESQRVYVSAVQTFLYPFLHATDSSVFVYSFAEPATRNSRRNTDNSSKIFSARLDTNLNSTTTTPEMIRISGPVKHKMFSPHNVFLIDNKTFIVNRGWDPDGVNYYPVNYNRTFGFSRVAINMDLTNSFRITVLDSNNGFLKDTIIEDHSGDAPLRWDNRFITASEKTIDFFFTRQFRASKNGMTHMYIDSSGKLTEDNIIVDERYEYYLPAATKLPGGLLLVPYGKNGRTMGIMKMQYALDTL